MKKMLFLFLLLYFSPETYGQVTDTTVKVKLWTIYPGYVVTKSGDTIQGYLKLKNLVNNQDKVLFYLHPDDEKYTKKYKPKMLKVYKVGPRYYESFKFRPPVTYAGNDANTYHFVLKIIDGPFSLYRWYYESTERSKQRVKVDENNPAATQIDLSFSEEELLTHDYGKTPDGDFIDLNSMKLLTNFKKNMSKLVGDYPELAKKIKNKLEGYRYANLEKIINEYNSWYLKNHKR